MRIQHNIAAMNAYRNYNNNTSSLSKNLEKLSSGYKINRAGDDAAGLAISEKMRAQITGLNAAQKNVKDGVSLVKTAEGAMQEIQDMLNRMDYLATQSANGTYDNEVDRANLQKEVDALKTEINRIADSANFNGIKLLDGSLDANKAPVDASSTTTTETIDPTEDNQMIIGGALPEVGLELGTDTVLHNTKAGDKGTEFSIALHDFEFTNQEGDEMSIKVGDTTITLKSTAAHVSGTGASATNVTLKGQALVDAIANGTTGNYEVYVNGERYDAGDKITINGQDFTMTKGSTVEGANAKSHSLTFTQDKAPVDANEEVNGSMKVSISGDIAATKAKFSFKLDYAFAAGDKLTIGEGRTAAEITLSGSDLTSLQADLDNLVDYEAKVEGTANSGYTITLTAKEAGAMDTPKVSFTSPKTAAAVTGTPTASVVGVAATGTGTITLGGATTVNIGGTVVNVPTGADNATGTITVSGKEIKYTLTSAGALTVEAATAGTAANTVEITASTAGGAAVTAATLAGGVDEVKGSTSYDVSNMEKGSVLTIGGDNGLKISQEELSKYESGKRVTINGVAYNVTYTTANNSVTVAQASAVTAAGAITDTLDTKVETNLTPKVTVEEKGADVKVDGMTGDYNVSTVDIKNVNANGQHRLASTYFDLTEDMVREGSEIRIGNTTYTFTADPNSTAANKVDISSGDLATIAKNLTDAAAAKNDTWTLGHDGNRITLTETMANDGLYTDADNDGKYDFTGNARTQFDLRTKEGIEASLGFKGVAYEKSETTTTEAQEGGKPLTLQIGDTSEDFNQMKVSIGDMHVSAMKLTDEESGESTSIADIDISTQDGAAKAVDVIKASINYVSSVRGDLGAIQNRLEHTQNNLSVMAENIQDAESTIRDTDVAEEMMSYVKNNILVQSAQAMLAQANQLPQGVLQLLG